MPRATDYFGTYMAGLALPALYEQVERDFVSTEQRRDYVAGLVAQQDQLIADLERSFRAQPVDSAALQALLEQLTEARKGQRDILAAQGGEMSPEARRAFKDRVAQDAFAVADELEQMTGVTRAQHRRLVDLWLEATTSDDGAYANNIGGARTRAANIISLRDTNAERNDLPYAEVGLGEADQVTITRLEESIEAMRNRSPEGIRGGIRGEEEIARRRNAAAPDGSGFATEEDAYQAALVGMADGVLDLNDFAGNEEALAVAQRVYDQARALGAYRNDERANFENSMLAARQRLAQLEQQAEQLAAPAGMSREQELARRQAEALGYDFSKPYVRYQKSRYYSNLVRGDELFNAALEASRTLAAEDPDRFMTPQGMGSVVLPTNRSQTLARDFVAQRWNAGDQSLNMRELERQLGKVLRGDDLQEALSFAVAFHKGLRLNIANPTDAELQVEAQRRAADEKEQRRQAYETAERLRQEAAERTAVMEAEQQDYYTAAVGQIRAEQSAVPEATRRLVQRLNVQGFRGREVRARLNEAYDILTTEGIPEDARLRALEDAGFSEQDRKDLVIAFGPQLRRRVTDATDEELALLADNPVFAEAVEQQRALRAPRAEIEPLPDQLLERQRREGIAPSGRISVTTPPLTAAQRATFEALDDATLGILAETGSVYAREILNERQAAPAEAPVEEPAQADEAPIVPEPGTRYSYQRNPDGSYNVFVDGRRTGVARQGTRAHTAIGAFLSGDTQRQQEQPPPAQTQPPAQTPPAQPPPARTPPARTQTQPPAQQPPTIDGDVTPSRILPPDQQPPAPTGGAAMPVMSAEAQRISDLFDEGKNQEGIDLIDQLGDDEERVLNEIEAFRNWRKGQGQ